MLKKSLLLFPLLIGGGVLLTGAWPGSLSYSPSNPQTSFLPQPLPVDGFAGTGVIHPKELLEKAIENLSGNRASWLKTKIRQTMTDGEFSFVAEGWLQRGPNQCAHLDLRVLSQGISTQFLFVSDGAVLAQESTTRDQPANIECTKLPLVSDPPQNSELLARETFLAGKACGGPLSLLRQLRPRLQNLKLQTGLFGGQPMIQCKGELSAPQGADKLLGTLSARYCCLFLDAKTLWPHRIEWWAQDRFGRARAVLQIEFREPVVNQGLSVDECVHMFSYQPKAGAEAATPAQ